MNFEDSAKLSSVAGSNPTQQRLQICCNVAV